MILYRNDCAHHKEAMVHVQTKNESFKRMHFVLKGMGIQNNAFFLALHNKELATVDPFNYDHLTTEEIAAISVEAKINPWYYLRELVRIPTTGVDPIPFILNRAGLFMYWSFFNSTNLFLIEPRQTGKTITSESLLVYLNYIVYKNVRTKLFTHSNKLIQENVEKFKMIRDNIPSYLVMPSNKDVENKEEVKYGALNNVYTTKTAQQTVSGAYNAGRGGTVLVNQLDEAPFCANIHLSYPVLMNAKNAAVAAAKKAHIPYADLITTTAGRLDSESGRYVYDIKQKCLFFSEKFFDFNSNAELRYALKKGSMNNMLYAEYSYRQLGYTKEWADEVARENNLQPDEIQRDLENIWTMGSDRPGVNPDLLAKIVSYETDPVEIKEVDGYLFNWYEKEEEVWANKDRFFVIGLDTSENINEDFTTVHMLDVADLSTVMTSKCNDQELIKLAMYIAKILVDHPNVILVPERKSTAAVLISLICAELWKAEINPFTRIYNMVFQNRTVEPYSRIDVNSQYATEGPTKKYLGFHTTATGENSRDALYKLTMNRALNINYSSVRDKNLISELKALTLTDRGRIDHRVGEHDDATIAMLLACWFVIHGKNHYLYGMPVHLKLSRVSADGSTVDMTKSARQRQLAIKITELDRQIRATSDAIVRVSLSRERNFLKQQLDALGPEIKSIPSVGDAQQPPVKRVSPEEIIAELDAPMNQNKYAQQFAREVNDPFNPKRDLAWDTRTPLDDLLVPLRKPRFGSRVIEDDWFVL
ncbi:MAG: hypothetical protein K2H85_05210 [Allobaculum sp.]|nr:hypothetical protein [Allobaculum sp.]